MTELIINVENNAETSKVSLKGGKTIKVTKTTPVGYATFSCLKDELRVGASFTLSLTGANAASYKLSVD